MRVCLSYIYAQINELIKLIDNKTKPKKRKQFLYFELLYFFLYLIFLYLMIKLIDNKTKKKKTVSLFRIIIYLSLFNEREPYRNKNKKHFPFSILIANCTVPKYCPFTVFLMVKTEKLMFFGSVRFELFV